MKAYKLDNYRQIKVKYMGPTNYRGSRICIYEPARYNDETTIRVFEPYDYSIGDVQEQAYQHLINKGFMATYDFRKKSSASTGQKIIQMYPNQNNVKHKMEERVENLEIKLDKILNLLENKKDD